MQQMKIKQSHGTNSSLRLRSRSVCPMIIWWYELNCLLYSCFYRDSLKQSMIPHHPYLHTRATGCLSLSAFLTWILPSTTRLVNRISPILRLLDEHHLGLINNLTKLVRVLLLVRKLPSALVRTFKTSYLSPCWVLQ